MEHKQSVRSLFLQFLKFGCFTFGGGWSIVAQIQQVYVEEKQTISNEELLDLTSVGRSMPGVMIANVAMLFGCRSAGPLGGLVCVLGLTLPPLVLLSVISLCYTAFRNSFWVAAAMRGVQAAVVPIIFCAAVPLMKSAFSRRWSILAAVLAFGAYLLGVSCVWIVVMGGALGLLAQKLARNGGQAE